MEWLNEVYAFYSLKQPMIGPAFALLLAQFENNCN